MEIICKHANRLSSLSSYGKCVRKELLIYTSRRYAATLAIIWCQDSGHLAKAHLVFTLLPSLYCLQISIFGSLAPKCSNMLTNKLKNTVFILSFDLALL